MEASRNDWYAPAQVPYHGESHHMKEPTYKERSQYTYQYVTSNNFVKYT